MKCPEFEKINLYIDGELAKAEMSEVKNHLSTCADCRSFIEDTIASENLMRHKIHQYVGNNSVKTAVLEAIKKEQIIPVSPKTNKAFYFRFALASIFSLAIMFALFSIYSKPRVPNVYNENTIQCSSLSCFIDGKPFHNSMDFKGSLSEPRHYSGAFVFSVRFEGQVSKVSWIGSGTLLFAPQGEKVIINGQGKLEVLAGKKINAEFNGKFVKYQNDVIILQNFSNDFLSNQNKSTVTKSQESNAATDIRGKTIKHDKKIASSSAAASNASVCASASVSASKVATDSIECKAIKESRKPNITVSPLSSSSVYLNHGIKKYIPITENTQNPFKGKVIKLRGVQE